MVVKRRENADLFARIGHILEQFFVEAFLSEPAAQGFVVSILIWLPRINGAVNNFGADPTIRGNGCW